MSTKENINEHDSAENSGEGVAGEAKNDKGLGFGIIFFIVAFALSFIVATFVFPELLYSTKEQPFSFDHVLHVNEAGSCDTCHFVREDGSFSGIPKLENCLECHEEEPMGDTEDEAKFAELYVAQEKEIPWHVYSKQPDCVFFSHVAHIQSKSEGGAGMDCSECHGHIGESTVSRPYEENRITGYSRDIWGKNLFGVKKHSWDRMKMDDCAECHQKETSHKGYCFQCHK